MPANGLTVMVFTVSVTIAAKLCTMIIATVVPLALITFYRHLAHITVIPFFGMVATVFAIIGITAGFFVAQHIAVNRFAISIIILAVFKLAAAVIIAIVVTAFTLLVGIVFGQQIAQQTTGSGTD